MISLPNHHELWQTQSKEFPSVQHFLSSLELAEIQLISEISETTRLFSYIKIDII